MSNILNILTDITSAILDHAFDLCLEWIYEDLTHLVGRAQIMNSLTHLGVEVPPPIIGMIIEQLLRAMPNVCILLIREMSDIYDELLPEVHSYSVIGYPNTRRPANACQIYVQIHSFNRINLNLPEDDAVVWRMSPGHLQLLEQIVAPYDHIRSLSSQIVSGYGNPCVFVQFILYYPDQLFIDSTGELEWYEMYRILDNDALGFESDTPR
ncbi:hypothetical protein H4R24_002110 [Coemansia sp. RSA 988]|nr:hypothetical protein H4R24_002110 [Coemansia sp. RSA 988]